MKRILLAIVLLIAGSVSADTGVRITGGSRGASSGGGGGGIAGVEERCTDLGSNCLFSEPLDTNDTLYNNGADAHNFTDSPSSHDANQWNRGFASDSSSSAFSFPLASSVAPMPSGSTVTRVMQLTGGGANWLYGKDDAEASDRRMCLRYYMRVSDDFTGAGYPGDGCQTERNKVMQFAFTGSKLIQLEERSNFGSGCYGPGTYKNFWLPNHASSDTPGEFVYDWDDCNSSSGWCSFEVCVGGNLAAGTGITVEGRIKKLATGVVDEVTTSTGWNAGAALGGTELIGLDLFHGQGSGGDTGEKWISHAMQAAWSTDDGQWIGCAPEVEGPTLCPVAGGD